MITVGLIRNGATYLSHHLRKNDYWSENEREVRGEWIGEGARALGLTGLVTDKPFEALRQNRHPQTGEALTARDQANRVAFFDVQLSAPKDVSVLAMVGGDERIREAFVESVKTALAEMESFAAVRERRGEAAGTEAFRLTGNFVGALFVHDASRDLDPQLHGHAVLANATWDPARNAWLALQPVEMLRASTYLRQVMYRELASRLRSLGYEPYDMNSKGFAVRGAEYLRERFSKRTRQVQQLAEKFAAEKGRKPTKREVEILVRESRQDKLTEISTPAVRAKQRAEITPEEMRALEVLVRAARNQTPRLQFSHGNAQQVLEAALRHVYERTSVAREGEVLSAALELHPDFYRWRELRVALETHPEAIRQDGEMTLRPIRREEAAAVERVRTGRNQRFPLGKYHALWHDYDDALVANLLPFSSTPAGHLENAEFIYEGPNGNLVGGRTFVGDGSGQTPQNAVVIGTTGSGKSVNVIDILTQTEPFYHYTMIVEEGESYTTYAKTVDPSTEPVIVQANGKLTMNYLDTRGLPLSGLHLSAAAALPMLMVGQSKDEDRTKLRQALLTNAIGRLYDDFAQWYLNRHPEARAALARRAFALERYRRDRMGPQATQLDAFLQFSEYEQTSADEAAALVAQPDEGEIIRFSKDSAGVQQVRDLIFSCFSSADQPQHGHLQELLSAEASGPHAEEMRYLATLLEPWSAGGSYGELFDGISNVNLTGKIAHFELG